MGTTSAQKKLFFNLKKIKNQLSPNNAGDLNDVHVEEISNWQKKNKNKKIVGDTREIITIIGDSHADNFALLFQTNPDLFPNFKFVPVNINKFNDIMNNTNNNTELALLIKKSNIIIFSFNYTED